MVTQSYAALGDEESAVTLVALSRRSGGRSRLTIALLVFTSSALLTLDFRDAEVVQSARRVAGTVFSPLRGAAETVASPFSNAWHGITDYGDIKSENEDLRERLSFARSRDEPAAEREGVECDRREHGRAGRERVRRGGQGDCGLPGEDAGAVTPQRW